MLQASTSPFYPLFSSLDVNAQMHADKAGRVLWDDMVKLGIEARKAVRRRFAGFLDPFVPDTVEYRGKKMKWEDVPTDVLAREQAFWQLDARRQVARLSPSRRRRGDGRSDEAHADDARHRHADRQVREERHSGDDPGQLPAREQRDPGKERPEQHPLPDDAGGRRRKDGDAAGGARALQGSLRGRQPAFGGRPRALCTE